jgi:CRISPR-associated protein Cmr5
MAGPKQAESSKKAVRMTLEQQRAAHAWDCAQNRGTEYVNLAKGLPALIMNSGLLQVMAFLNEKGSPSSDLAQQLRSWVHKRFPEVPEDFTAFMQALMRAEPRKFQAITAECFAWLRWLRQIAPAVPRKEP